LASALLIIHTFVLPTAAGAQARLAMPRVFAQGADAQTTAAFELLLLQELRRQVQDRLVADGDAGADPCAEPGCAALRARRLGVEAALLCTLTRLGDEHVVVLSGVDAAGRVVWSHRVAAPRPEDLDDVAARLAEAVASGRLPKAATDRRTGRRGDTGKPPRRRPSDVQRSGAERCAVDAPRGRGAEASSESADAEPRRSLITQGPRFGPVYPLGASYAGAPRLMSFAWVWRHQTPTFAVEAVPALGFAWGGDLDENGGQARDWSILDLFVTWTPLPADVAPLVGAGLGLHGLRLQRETATGRRTDSTLGVSLATGVGLALFRTYDFQVALDVRYHVFLDRFEAVDGRGAHGFTLTFGLQRR
jgi:hypothetical protein